MQDKSEREKLIEKLHNDKSIRIEIPEDIIDDVNPDNKRDYIVLAEYRRYLMRRRKNADDIEREALLKEIFRVQQYMSIAQYGDENIGRFNRVE
jgi:hypothetical protein